MKGFVRFPVNLVANLCVLALCPFLVLAWIVRVRMHERAWRRVSVSARTPVRGADIAPLDRSKTGWTTFGGPAGSGDA